MDDGYYWCHEKTTDFWEPCSVRRMKWGFELRFIGQEHSINVDLSEVLNWDFKPLETP